jgi:D-alanyl-D-alanine carboxypeptidase/D-alanyl-D-alanine-endopeptidase (penicillin-binding protein 4)
MKQMKKACPMLEVWLSLMLALLGMGAAAFSAAAQEPAAEQEPAAANQSAAEQPAAERSDVARFRQRVEAALSSNGAERGYWGALVVDAETGETLYALNADHYFKPASNIKLFTTTMALATLGPDFRARTTVETTGTLTRSGQLRGDLVLVGRGDANLSNRVFPFAKQGERAGPADKVLAELADQVVARGVKQIRGDIVADDSYFALARFPPGWTVDDTVWSYGAAVSAIAVNDNFLSLQVRPGAAAGAPVRISWEPWPGTYTVRNEARTVAAGTADATLVLSRDPESRVFRLGGTLAADAPARSLSLAVPEPAELAAEQLKRLLEARGVRISGRSRARHAGEPAPVAQASPAKVLAERLSPTLIEDMRLTNKMSQNLHAELMLRVAAKEAAGAETLEQALKFAAQFRESIGLAPGDVLQSDGSGLSRNGLATPQSVAGVLLYAARQTWGEDFASTLPVAGEDGTMENRMKGTAAVGRVWAKTGTINSAVALSGYATSLGGQRLVFSLFGNNNAGNGRDAAAVLDAICVAMVEELGTEIEAPAEAPAEQPAEPLGEPLAQPPNQPPAEAWSSQP